MNQKNPKLNLVSMFQVSSMDQCLKVQEQLGAELQKQIKRLSDNEEEHKQINEKKSEEIREFEEKFKDLRSQTEETQKQLRDTEAQILSLEKQKAELEEAAEETQVKQRSCQMNAYFLCCVYSPQLYISQTIKLNLFLIQIVHQAQTQKINDLLEQMSSLEGELTASRDEAQKLLVLKNELDLVNQSCADLKNSMEALERSHSSTIEIKSSLENTLTEKNHLIFTLETEVKELKEKRNKESESHSLEIENVLNRERRLREKLEAAKQSVTAAKAELDSRREEIKTMKTALSAALQGLEERDHEIKSLKEKLNKAEAEQTKTSELLKEKNIAMNKIKVGHFLSWMQKLFIIFILDVSGYCNTSGLKMGEVQSE